MAVSLKILGVKELLRKIEPSSTVQKPLAEGVRKLTLKVEGEVKKATVVDTGRLRSSESHSWIGEGAMVGTNVEYAPFVEYGTEKMASRHMEGGRKVLGEGMFAYTLRTTDMEGFASELSKKIEKEMDK